jgi:hypothetical protein
MQAPRVAAQLAEIGMPTPAEVLGYLLTADAGLRRFCGDTIRNTDDNSRIEYDTPKGLSRDSARGILAALDVVRVNPWEYVTAPDPPSENYERSAARGADILRANREYVRSMQMQVHPSDLAGREALLRLLQEVLRLNPHDAFARRDLDSLSRQ